MPKAIRLPKVDKVKAQSFTKRVTCDILEDLNTPVSLSVYLLIKYNEYQQLVDKDIEPLHYRYAYDFAKDYQSISILKKADFLPLDIDRDQVAIDKFIQAENQCRVTNDRLSEPSLFQRPENRWEANLLSRASHKISKILGNLPSFDKLDFRFGPGASSTCKGSSTTLGDKLQSHISITPNALSVFNEACASLPHLVAAAFDINNIEAPFSVTSSPNVEMGNRLTTVPKSSKTNRCICIEPHTNIVLQKGVGDYIRKRLKYNNLDLSNQASKNAWFAREGSINGNYATIDLSSASDTISYLIVMELLPREWFDLLDSLRSPYTQMPDGSWLENEKFSSMGNGFTFELETLIFLSLAVAVKEEMGIEGEVMAFGDDLIVPTEMASSLISLLSFCGFTTNKEKTFVDGPFRESCGKDYFLGVNVRPFFIKELIKYETDKFKVANAIRLYAARLASGNDILTCCDSTVYRSWSRIIGAIPSKYRLFGPQYFGDSTIFCTRSEAVEHGHLSRGRVEAKIIVPIPKTKPLSRFTGSVCRSVSLYGGTRTSSRSEIKLSVRGSSGRAYIKSKPTPDWGWQDGCWV